MASGAASYSVSATNYGRNSVDSYYQLSAPGVVNGNQTVTGNLIVQGTSDLVGNVTAGAAVAVAGVLSAATVNSAGAVNAVGALTGASAAISGAATAASVAATGAVTAASVTATGAISGGSAAIVGAVTAGSVLAGVGAGFNSLVLNFPAATPGTNSALFTATSPGVWIVNGTSGSGGGSGYVSQTICVVWRAPGSGLLRGGIVSLGSQTAMGIYMNGTASGTNVPASSIAVSMGIDGTTPINLNVAITALSVSP